MAASSVGSRLRSTAASGPSSPDTGVRRAAVTGATGYVGSALASRLVQEGWAVRGLVRSTSSPEVVAWLGAQGVELVHGDLDDAGALARLVQGADVVHHCAAVIGYRRRLAGAMQRTNVMGTSRVVGACVDAGVGRLVHVSSIAAVGLSDEPAPLLDETAPFNAGRLRAPYFSTKREAEQRVLDAVDGGLDAVIVNPGAIYGPAAVAAGNSAHVIRLAASGRLAFVPTGGINAVALSTVLEGILAAAEKGRTGRRYILGGENLTYLHLMKKIGRAAGHEPDPSMLPGVLGPSIRWAMNLVEPLVPDRVWFTPDLAAAFGRWMWFDTGRMQTELGVPATPIQASLEGAVEQLRRRGDLPR